jgi:Zn-dependent metalloprotease
MDASTSLTEGEFLAGLKRSFEIPDEAQFHPGRPISGQEIDPNGGRYIRYTQHYKGLEMARTQYILHLKNGRVTHAHGQLAGEPKVDLQPRLSREEAFQYACSHLGLDPMEARKNRALLSRLSLGHDPDTDNGSLMLSAGFESKIPENYRLVYSFDMSSRDPLRRYDVEIDAHSGELVGKYPTLYHENIPTTGNSLYNGEVDIVISDTIFKEDWPDNEAYWHSDQWEAYQGLGSSWWMADTANFSPGGYRNDWFVVLETDAIILTGTEHLLSFYHRYAMEDPAGASDYDPDYDGWDGINVRISADGGRNWEVLRGPVPGYTCTSLWSFGGIHGEGPGTPGWAGRQTRWTRVLFDLSAYAGDTVRVRFDFASDGGYDSRDDNSMFGWQIDEIQVRNTSEVLYANTGSEDNIRPYSIANWVGRIEGKYRLRETTRGKGIATINAESGLGFVTYVDFVQDTFPVTNTVNRVGVGIHWASEQTYDYFLNTFGRNSYDNEGGAIVSYADWIEGDDRNNAFWSGSFAAYGAGDGVRRGSYGTIDVVGHELTHGLTDYSARLVYRGESGALNESFSDIFGTAVEFYAEGRDQGDWLMGEDIYLDIGAIRSMQNPKALSSPDTYQGEHWVDTNESFDNGGVHYNSGVQNYWFYLLSEGGSGENDDGESYLVSPIGFDDAISIAYRNLTQYLLPQSNYMDAASYSIQAAGDLFGEGSQQVLSVRDAWEAVGIYMDPRLTASDTLMEFVSPLDNSDYQLLVLRNKGIARLDITEFHFSDPGHFRFQTPRQLPLHVEGGDSLRLWIIFSPEGDSLHEATLTIENTDPLIPSKTIRLSGTVAGDPTSVPDPEQQDTGIRLTVSPNPFSEQLRISYALPHPDEITLEIRDITGKLLYRLDREAAAEESVEILWSSLPEKQKNASGGIYLLTLRTKNQLLVRKLVKQ